MNRYSVDIFSCIPILMSEINEKLAINKTFVVFRRVNEVTGTGKPILLF